MMKRRVAALLTFALPLATQTAQASEALALQFIARDAMPTADAPVHVVEQCTDAASADRGGPLAGLTIGWAASLVTEAIENRLRREIARYSAEVRSRRSFVPFYEDIRWAVDGDGQLVSCLYLAAGSCSAGDGRCASFEPSIELYAQVRRTDHYLQVRPLAWRSSRALPSKVHEERSSLAVQLDANAVWRPGAAGRTDRVFTTTLLTTRVGPQSRGQWNDVTPGWETAEALPLPPIGDDGQGLGVVGLQVTIAEVSAPPASLRFLTRYVEDNRRGLTIVLAQAIDDAIDGR